MTNLPSSMLTGRTATIPFVDPAKERPAQQLHATV